MLKKSFGQEMVIHCSDDGLASVDKLLPWRRRAFVPVFLYQALPTTPRKTGSSPIKSLMAIRLESLTFPTT